MKIDYYKAYSAEKDAFYVVLVNDHGFMLQLREWAYADDYPASRRHFARAGVQTRGWEPVNLDRYQSAIKIDSYEVNFKKFLLRRSKPCK